MHVIRLALLLGLVLFNLAAIAKEPKIEEVAEGQKLKTDYYDSGAVRAITRTDKEGLTIGTLYHDDTGVPSHLELLDREGKIKTKTHYNALGDAIKNEEYGPTGKPKTMREFDVESKTVNRIVVFGAEGNVLKDIRSKNGKPQKGEDFYPNGTLKTEHFFDAEGNYANRVDYDKSGKKIIESPEGK